MEFLHQLMKNPFIKNRFSDVSFIAVGGSGLVFKAKKISEDKFVAFKLLEYDEIAIREI